MIADRSVRAVEAARWGSHFMRPLYDSYCFLQIPRLIVDLFQSAGHSPLQERLIGPLAGRYQHVILIFVDAFGWQFLEEYAERYPFLQHFLQEGVVTRLTSQFPSTTAAHLTTIHTGLPPNQSAMYEWFIYEPSLDAVIVPLPFSLPGDSKPNTLLHVLDPWEIFPRQNIYAPLRALGVRPAVYGSQNFTPSPFGHVVNAGADIYPFSSLERGLHDLLRALDRTQGPSYSFFYWGGIDSASHKSGPGSRGFMEAADRCFTALESILHRGLSRIQNTLLLLTADHGQILCDPSRTIYLNRTLPEIVDWMQRDRGGRPRLPTGSPRDAIFHVQEAYLDEACVRLSEHLAGRAEVYLVSDLLAQGFFGPGEPAPAFTDRIGNLIVLPHAGELVWWYDPSFYIPDFRGYHGGLTPGEMETELMALGYG